MSNGNVIDVAPVEAESMGAIVPAKDMRVDYTPPRIVDNIDAVEAYIDAQLEPFVGARLDPDDDEQVKQGRAFMADLNKLKKPIEDERKRIKAEYEKPLKAFEARVKQITAKIDGARANLKEQVDAADAAFKEHRRAMLADEYEGCAGILADVIPFGAILEDAWLNRSTPERKAVDALGMKMMGALDGYNALNAMELAHKAEVMQRYCETLDTVAALNLEQELAERDRQRAEFEERRRQMDEQAAQRRAQAAAEAIERADANAAAYAAQGSVFVADRPEAEPERNRHAEPIPAASPEVYTWSLATEFTGTRAFAQTIAGLLGANGITNAKIKCKGVFNG